MIRFILVQVRSCSLPLSCLPPADDELSSLWHRTDKARPGSLSGVSSYIFSALLSQLTHPSAATDVPFDDDEKVRVRGEVHRLIAPRDQKYQSNFVEVCSELPAARRTFRPRSVRRVGGSTARLPSCRLVDSPAAAQGPVPARSLTPVLTLSSKTRSSATTSSSTAVTPGSSSPSASTPMTMSSSGWRRSICSWKY